MCTYVLDYVRNLLAQLHRLAARTFKPGEAFLPDPKPGQESVPTGLNDSFCTVKTSPTFRGLCSRAPSLSPHKYVTIQQPFTANVKVGTYVRTIRKYEQVARNSLEN